MQACLQQSSSIQLGHVVVEVVVVLVVLLLVPVLPTTLVGRYVGITRN